MKKYILKILEKTIRNVAVHTANIESPYCCYEHKMDDKLKALLAKKTNR